MSPSFRSSRTTAAVGILAAAAAALRLPAAATEPVRGAEPSAVAASASRALIASETATLEASDATAGAFFGNAASIVGDTAIVGARLVAGSTGAAYVFERDQGGPGNWGQVRKLVGSDAAPGHDFGSSVSIAGDLAIVGAFGDPPAGSAYLFARDLGGPDNWGQLRKLTPSDPTQPSFGLSVAILGDIAVVGSDPADPGAAWVFARDHGGPDNWGEVRRLAPADGFANDGFGRAVSIAGDTVAVGAPARFPDSPPGAVYLFERDQGGPGNWGQVRKLSAGDPQPTDLFGWSTSIVGDTLVVGAWGHDFGTTGGAAYVFERDQGGPGNWGQVRKLNSSDADDGDAFGMSVSLAGDLLLVGAARNDDDGFRSGSAYLFERDEGGPGQWGEIQKLTASDATAFDMLGFSASLSGLTAILGTPGQFLGPTPGRSLVFDIAFVPEVDLGVAKTESVDPVVAGSGIGNLRHIVTVTNAGPSDATAVELRETLTVPAGVTVDSVVPSAGAFAGDTWSLGDLASGASATLTVTFTASAAAAPLNDAICGTVAITALDQFDTDAANDTASECTSIAGLADLAVSRTASNDPVVAGTVPLVLVVTAANGGPSDASGVAVTEALTLPPGATLDQVVPSVGSFAGDTWALGALADGDSATLTVSLTVGSATAAATDAICGTATIATAEQTDVNPANDVASDCVTVTREVDIAVTKSESIDPVIAGSGAGNLTYVVTAGNGGPSDASNVALSEVLTLPAGVALETVVPSAGSFAGDTWSLASLAAGDLATLTVTLTAGATAAPGTDVIADTATLIAVDEPDVDPTNDAASEATSIAFSAILDFGDAPDPGFPTLLASDGARHGQPSALFLGAGVDPEADGQPTTGADGDDNDGNDDEEGVAFPSPLAPGTAAAVEVTASAAGLLSGWIDFDGDGDWGAPGDHALVDVPVAAGTAALTLPVPADARLGPTFARFRIASAGGLSFTGAAADGEVEDHAVTIRESLDDSDGDGVDDVVEDLAPLGGDGNQDGVLDKYQRAVTSLPSATTGDMLTLVTVPSAPGGQACRNREVVAIDPASLPPDAVATVSYLSIQGLLGYAIECAAAEVTWIVHGETDLASAVFRKYGSTASQAQPHWYSLPSTVGTVRIGGQTVATVSYELLDGGLGDDDLTADGRIVDPGGPALPVAGVPTLGAWAIAALALLLAGAGLAAVARTRRT